MFAISDEVARKRVVVVEEKDCELFFLGVFTYKNWLKFNHNINATKKTKFKTFYYANGDELTQDDVIGFRNNDKKFDLVMNTLNEE